MNRKTVNIYDFYNIFGNCIDIRVQKFKIVQVKTPEKASAEENIDSISFQLCKNTFQQGRNYTEWHVLCLGCRIPFVGKHTSKSCWPKNSN